MICQSEEAKDERKNEGKIGKRHTSLIQQRGGEMPSMNRAKSSGVFFWFSVAGCAGSSKRLEQFPE